MGVLNGFEGVLYAFPENLRERLIRLPQSIKDKTEEIRIRVNLPLSITVSGRTLFLKENGYPTEILTREVIKLENRDVQNCFNLLCHNSVYAHEEEIRNGYIMMDGGNRAGICGTVTENGICNITSVNIRIAREIKGCADSVAESFDGGGILIAGPPGSGKTTVLRDLIRRLSEGIERPYRISVIDSRGEIAGGGICNDLGPNTDVLFCIDKAAGAEMALRTMFPDIIAFDEIGTARELKSVRDILNAGVILFTTAHIGTKDDIMRRSVTSELIYSGAISKIAVLNPVPGEKFTIIEAEDLLDDIGF